jgi:SAM-dependent methyltransferase
LPRHQPARRRSHPRLTLRYAPGDDDWNAYFDALGKSAGQRDGAEFTVARAIANNIRAVRANILTERTTQTYDLVVATNVLLYFDDNELGLALSNIAHALKPGGHLLHNDLRPAIEQWGRQLKLPPIHARTVRIDPARELYDGVVLHQRGP